MATTKTRITVELEHEDTTHPEDLVAMVLVDMVVNYPEVIQVSLVGGPGTGKIGPYSQASLKG